MRNMVRVVSLVEGDGHLAPPELCWGGEGANGVHLQLSDVALQVGLVRLGAPKDLEAPFSLGELGVLLLGAICQFASLRDRLLGLALLAKGAMDVDTHGSIKLQEVLCLTPVE